MKIYSAPARPNPALCGVCEVARTGLISLTRAMRPLTFKASAAVVTDGPPSFDSREKRFGWKL